MAGLEIAMDVLIVMMIMTSWIHWTGCIYQSLSTPY